MPNEAETCRSLILPALHAAGWDEAMIVEQVTLTPGLIIPLGVAQQGAHSHVRQSGLRADYVLSLRRNIPLAVLEAKAAYKQPGDGLQQAMRHAKLLGVKFAYASNGHGIVEHDYLTGQESLLPAFPSPEALWARLCPALGLADPKDAADALSAYFDEVGGKMPRLLLTMATGTGKTLVAFQIVWRLWKAGRKKRILYLADRNVLVDQAKDRTFAPMGQALHKIQARAIKSREVYFALYQALANPGEGPNLYEKYPPDFFDLVIVDECHRSSARDESNWLRILEYFAHAQQIGMTATPRRADNADTYEYFGEPLYTYSFKQGIEDGFLAPYRVYRVIPDVDAHGPQIDPGVLDRFGREIPAGLYGTKEFERVVSLLQRTEAVARHLTDYLKRTNRYDKTIVFCVDQEYALDMRRALKNCNTDLAKIYLDYVERVVSDEGKFGRGHLDNFQDPEQPTPVILTTSQMLTTGVDAPTCSNIVLFRPVGSMIDFKQIIERGTRVLEEHNKYWFTIMDYVGATQLFYDPAFDGEPVRVTRTRIDGEGQETGDEQTGDGASEGATAPGHDPQAGVDGGGADGATGSDATGGHPGGTGEAGRKYYLDGVTVYIVGKQAFELDPQEHVLRTVAFTDYVAENVRRLHLDAENLRAAWPAAEQRAEILELLRQRGIDPAHLAQVTHHTEADPLDLLLHVAYNAPLVSRKQRAEKLRQGRPNFWNAYTPAARQILDGLLDKYADFGLRQLEDLAAVLNVPPFTQYGGPLEITQLFGGPLQMRAAVEELQKYLGRERGSLKQARKFYQPCAVTNVYIHTGGQHERA